MTSSSTTAAAEPYFQTAFPISEFARRRAAVAEAIGNGVAVLQGMPATGAFDLFRQDNDFFYLSGVETPHAYLTIDGRSGQSVLYLLPVDPILLEKEGAELNGDDAETAIRLTGVDDVKPLAALASDLANAGELYVRHQSPEGRQACQDTLRHAQHQAERDPWRPAGERFRQTIARLCPAAQVRD